MKLLRYMSRREHIIFYICIAVIIIAAIYSLIVEPVIGVWKDLKFRIARAEKELAKNLRLISREKEIIAEYEKYLSHMKGGVEKEKKSSAIPMEIDGLARKNNVITTDIKPKGIKNIDFYKKYIFDVRAEGNIKNLARFIYDMQNSAMILSIEYVSLNAMQAGSGILQADMRITHSSIR